MDRSSEEIRDLIARALEKALAYGGQNIKVEWRKAE